MRYLVVAAIGLELLAGSARAAGPPVLGFSVSSGTRSGGAPVSLPSASTPNAPGSISIPVSFTTPPALQQRLTLTAMHDLWQRAGYAYGIPWQVLASINKIESNFGQNMGPSSAGAVGWMQFMPSTWLRWGLDADGDGTADPWNPTDAIYAAARYLAAAGGQTDIARGVFAYNHADWYVKEVLDLARVYGQGGMTQTVDLQDLQAKLDEARLQVVAANKELLDAQATETEFGREASRRAAKADAVPLLSERLIAQHRAAQFGAEVESAHSATEAARTRLEEARVALESAHQAATAPSFAPGVGTLMGAPAFQNGYVFPVGGGPQLVSVAHTHHDYPAADIAAPAGTPVYALSNGVVLSAWHSPDARCGIGLTIRTEDGLVWTYCHLAYLEPMVVDGVSLSAGTPIGFVGSTGHATGPHLHLQLQPATSYPQDQFWFQAFAGKGFRWQDAPTPLEPTESAAAARTFGVPEPHESAAAPRTFSIVSEPSESTNAPRTFAVVPESRDVLIGFTRGGS